LYLVIKFGRIGIRLDKIEGGKRKYKRKSLVFSVVALLIIALLTLILKTNITGKIINNLSSYNWKSLLMFFITVAFITLLIVLRKKLVLVYKNITEFLSEIINKDKRYSSNTIRRLIKKKVYSESGDYLGKIEEVILGKNKIESLKIHLKSKKKIKTKGIIIKYDNVKAIKRIVIIRDFKTDEIKEI
jgi:sporulation protein YlmC with PRC-barrel domain